MLDQRFRHAGIDGVMRHLIADAVSAPAEREFGKIAGADHEGIVLVGEAEQIVGPQPRLHILERDVIDRLALAERMAEIGQHLPRGGADIEFVRVGAEAGHQAPGIGLWSHRRWRSPAWCR